MIEIFGIISGLLAVVGVLLNNRMMESCFYVWTVSNFMSLVMHWHARKSGAKGMVPMMLRDVVFMILAIEGLLKWEGLL